MPVFRYTGVDARGKKSLGVVDAENERAARLKLRRMGIFPTEVGEEGVGPQKVSLTGKFDPGSYLKRVKLKDVALMTRQLSTLLNAHIPLVDALTAISDQMENLKLKAVLTNIRERVTEGTKFSDALKAHPKIFGDLYVNMINAGESSGTLNLVCERLSEFVEGQVQLRGKMMGAMMYPIIMAVLAVVMIVVLLIVLVPKLTSIFAETGQALPLPTRIMIGASSMVSNYWYVFIVLIGLCVWGWKKWMKTDSGRHWYDKRILKFPIFGKLNRMVVISRFTRTLATLLSSGVPLLVAMDIVRNMITNSVIKRVVEQTRDNVREGQSVAEPLRRSGEFPPLVTHMIAIGEKTGGLEVMLEKIADSYDTEVNNLVSTLTTLLEPIMILAMAAVIGFIVISVLLPIMKLNQLAM